MDNAYVAVFSIFNNWTALKIAVDQSGARNAQVTVLNLIDNVIETMERAVLGVTNHFEKVELVDHLVYTMDSEFNTLCEDDSPEEIVELIEQIINCVIKGENPLELPGIKSLPKTGYWIPAPIWMPVQKEAAKPTIVEQLSNCQLEGVEDAAMDVGSAEDIADDPVPLETFEDSGAQGDVEDSEDEKNNAGEASAKKTPSVEALYKKARTSGRKKKSRHHAFPVEKSDDDYIESDVDQADADDGEWEDVLPRKRR